MTTDKLMTLQMALTKANPNDICDALRKVDLGMKMSVVKVVFASLTSAAAQDITTAAAKAAATVTGITLDPGQNLPAIGKVITCRVTAGAAAAGSRSVTDAGGTATTLIALLSDDGKSLTFESTITGLVLTYEPRSAVAPTAEFGSAV
jgi:hypothetical protein